MNRALLLVLSFLFLALPAFATDNHGLCEINGYASEYKYDPDVRGMHIQAHLMKAVMARNASSTTNFYDDGSEWLYVVLKVGTVTISDMPVTVSENAKAPVTIGKEAMARILEAYADQLSRISDATAYPSVRTSIYDIVTILSQVEPDGYNGRYAQLLYERARDYGRYEAKDLLRKSIEKIESQQYSEGKELLDIIAPTLDGDNPLWPDVYFYYALCHLSAENEQDYVKYMNKAISAASGEMRACIRMSFADYYRKKDMFAEEEAVLRALIDEYCTFLKVKAEDCWNKKLTDETIAKALGVLSEDAYAKRLYPKFKIYAVYAAAWGCSESCAFCNENGFEYGSLPAFRLSNVRTVLNN